MTKQKTKRPPSSLLGLKLDKNRIEGVVVRRSGSGVQAQKSFQAPLSLDPLTNDAELVGREILNQLNSAGIRERNCAVCVPLSWALTLQVPVPELPDEDVAEFLSLEAEKGFPYSPDELISGVSRFRTPSGEHFATLVAIPKAHLVILEKALRAAKLKPLSFSLTITSIQSGDADSRAGLVSMWVSENGVELQVTSGDGIVALRSIHANSDSDAGAKPVNAELLAREVKITLGQLPRSLAEGVSKLRLFGRPESTQGLLREIRPRADLMGLEVESGGAQRINGFTLPAGKEEGMSPAFALAARVILGSPPVFEFLPPKISRFPLLVAKFSSKKIFPIAAAAALVVIGLGGPIGYRSYQVGQLKSQLSLIDPEITRLTKVQANLRKYQPWYSDFSMLEMSRMLWMAFPAAGGEATAKTIQVKEPTKESAISPASLSVKVTGLARNQAAATSLENQIRLNKPRVADFHTGPYTQSAQSQLPLQFTIDFQWVPPVGVN